jgi:hypothetical protein
MGLLWHGRDLFFTQPEREGSVIDPDPHGDVIQQKLALGFPLWGGDKTWLAPQSAWNGGTPYLDLDTGPYRLDVISHGPEQAEVSMTSRICRETGLRFRRTVLVTADRLDFAVRHEMQNASDHPIQGELWDVTMVARPGVVYLPTWPESMFPEGVKTYEGEGSSVGARGDVVHAHGSYAAVSCHDPIAFKFGVDGPAGWVTAVLEQADGALVGYRKSMPVSLGSTYAHGCVAEVYNSDAYRYIELEIHGPTVSLQPGEHFAIEERQCVVDVPRLPSSDAEVNAIGTA